MSQLRKLLSLEEMGELLRDMAEATAGFSLEWDNFEKIAVSVLAQTFAAGHSPRGGGGKGTSMPKDDSTDEQGLRLAALQLLLAALSPDADDTNEFTRTVLNMLEPVRDQNGRVYVDVERLRFVLNESVAEARSLLPEQDPAVEQAIDEGFEEIAEHVDRLTAPKAQH